MSDITRHLLQVASDLWAILWSHGKDLCLLGHMTSSSNQQHEYSLVLISSPNIATDKAWYIYWVYCLQVLSFSKSLIITVTGQMTAWYQSTFSGHILAELMILSSEAFNLTFPFKNHGYSDGWMIFLWNNPRGILKMVWGERNVFVYSVCFKFLDKNPNWINQVPVYQCLALYLWNRWKQRSWKERSLLSRGMRGTWVERVSGCVLGVRRAGVYHNVCFFR